MTYYSFHSDELDDHEEEDHQATVQEETRRVGKEAKINSEHDEYEIVDSKDLESCSRIDEEDLDLLRSNYAEFDKESNMKELEFKIGMKFRSFKQFKGAIKNYGTKNRCVMNFKPNNKKRCKVFLHTMLPLVSLGFSNVYRQNNYSN